MVKPKPIFLFVPLNYLYIFLVVFLVLENFVAVVTSRQDVIYMFIWSNPRSPWHVDNLLDLLIFVNKIEPSPFTYARTVPFYVRRLIMLDEFFQGRVTTMIADNYNLRMVIGYADLLIGAVLVPGAKAPKLITREMLKTMRTGAVLVDVSIDQGECAETSRPTTHSHPIYEEEGIIHYTVTNMPGAVPRTSTRALTLNTLPYVLEIVEKGWIKAIRENPALAKGVNLVEGRVTYKAVAEAFNLSYTPLKEVL
jgi:alanine dehydrogenase